MTQPAAAHVNPSNLFSSSPPFSLVLTNTDTEIYTVGNAKNPADRQECKIIHTFTHQKRESTTTNTFTHIYKYAIFYCQGLGVYHLALGLFG